MGVDPNDPESVQLFLHFLQQREEQERQQAERPCEHYMTIAQNGMILEATKTITGFPPDSLLMTSAYDTVYEDDLPGLLAVKSQFWDNGNPDVEAYIRRRTQEGEWIWLVAKAVSYVEQPIPGIILVERRVVSEDRDYDNLHFDGDYEDYETYKTDMESLFKARRVNAITRITAILVQAVEAAQEASAASQQPGEGESNNNNNNNLHNNNNNIDDSSLRWRIIRG